MRRIGEVLFCVGMSMAVCGWGLLVVAGPILGNLFMVKIAAGIMVSGFGVCMAMGIAALWSDVLGRK